MRFIICLIVCLFALSSCGAQKEMQYTKRLSQDQRSPDAQIKSLDWLAGTWVGEAFGGTFEEVWSPPSGDSMMGMFKLTNEGTTSFYELIIIREIENTLILQLKHFGDDLKGWEEKDETMDFKLVQMEPDAVHFEGYSFYRKSNDQVDCYVVIDDEGKKTEYKFEFKRE